MTALSHWVLHSAMPDSHCLEGLAEGIALAPVQALLGLPAAEARGDGLTARHYLVHEPRRGWMPWVLVFDGSSGALLHLFVDASTLRAYDDLLANLLGPASDGPVPVQQPQRRGLP